MTNHEFETLLIEEPAEAVCVIRFNRPASRNALSWQLIREFKQALLRLNDDNKCRVIVITGAGRSFCAGMDLRDQLNPESLQACIGEVKQGPASGMKAQEYMAEMMQVMRRIQQPIIAAVNGHAYGGGLGIALAADLRLAGESARFCTQFIRLGLSGCDAGVSYTLPHLIGAGRAHDMIMTARVVDAALAERWGLVTRLVPDEALEEETLALAKSLCDFSPYGLIATKQGMWAALNAASLEEAQHIENRNQIMTGMSGDVEEAVAAFLEKRKPVFD